MADINFDELERARQEALPEEEREAKTLTFGGSTYTLPAEMPWSFAEAAALRDDRGALSALIGPEAAAEFFDLDPSVNAIEHLGQALADLYTGRTVGESRASRSTSRKTSASSRRPSPTSTPDSPEAISA